MNFARKMSLSAGILSLLWGMVFTASAQVSQPLAGTQWQLVSIDGAPVVPGSTVTLGFGADGMAYGTGGCNTFSGTYTTEGEGISFGMLISTLMACMEEGRMEQEQVYFSALQSASTYALDGETLVITYGVGQSLVFSPLVVLVDTQWQLVSIDGAPVAPGSTVTLGFGDDGMAYGTGGCNTFSGTYATEGEGISFGMLISTLMACMEEGRMEQETAFFDALQNATRYILTDDQLIIVYGDDQQLVFAPQAGLAGTQWQLVSINGASTLAESAITLAFGDDGRISGSGGCNGYGASYALEGNAVEIGMIVSTLRACAQDGIMAQETAYLGLLQSISRYDLMGGTLTLSDDAGQTLVFAPLAGLLNTAWQLVSLGGEAVIADSILTLMLDEAGQVSGSAGCNTYGGAYTLADDQISFSALFSTRRACLEEALMAQEQAFLSALETATAYALGIDQLIIVYGEGQQLVFAPASAEMQ